ncbi:MAG: hypothetical protein QOD71_290 [Thermoleophilaceae bacterium]|jgi:uncharacterized protein YbcI|nr:hypothetical protein [Thermoleophilaceae bacterium]
MDDDARVLPDETAAEHRGMQTAELSNAMVRVYKEQFGRGPTKAHSVFATSDLLVCTLENSLTPAERRMAQLGEHQRIRDIRTFFQHASEPEFIQTVEQITGRRVRAFVSGTDTQHDVSSEVFYLHPQADTSSP